MGPALGFTPWMSTQEPSMTFICRLTYVLMVRSASLNFPQQCFSLFLSLSLASDSDEHSVARHHHPAEHGWHRAAGVLWGRGRVRQHLRPHHQRRGAAVGRDAHIRWYVSHSSRSNSVFRKTSTVSLVTNGQYMCMCSSSRHSGLCIVELHRPRSHDPMHIRTCDALIARALTGVTSRLLADLCHWEHSQWIACVRILS